jgi:CHAD domain-containing protein
VYSISRYFRRLLKAKTGDNYAEDTHDFRIAVRNAILLVQPAKAEGVMEYQLTGHGVM